MLKFKDLVDKLFPKYEYLYFHIVDTKIYSYQKENFRNVMMQEIRKDLKSTGKKIVDIDFHTDAHYDSTVILTTDSLKNKFFLPLIYQIYAFIKKKDVAVFNYKFKVITLNVQLDGKAQELTIYKFKIKC
jgi:hypothetical protein